MCVHVQAPVADRATTERTLYGKYFKEEKRSIKKHMGVSENREKLLFHFNKKSFISVYSGAELG